DPSTTQISFRQRLKNPENVAISFQADQVHAVGGFLVAGDEVNMMIMEDESGTTNGSTTDQGNNNNNKNQSSSDQAPAILKSKARMLYQKVQILAVGQNAKLQPGESTATTNADGSSSSSSQNNSNNNIFTTNVPAEASLWVASANQSQIYM